MLQLVDFFYFSTNLQFLLICIDQTIADYIENLHRIVSLLVIKQLMNVYMLEK